MNEIKFHKKEHEENNKIINQLGLPCRINSRRYDVRDPRCECKQGGRNKVKENILKSYDKRCMNIVLKLFILHIVHSENCLIFQ